MTKRLKDTPGLSDYVKKNDSFKRDKLIKVFDKKTNKHMFKKQSEIVNNIERFKPINKGSPFINEVQKIMEEREPNGRRSNTDIRLAEKKLKMSKGGRIGLRAGSTGCKLAMKGKGRAYGKNS